MILSRAEQAWENYLHWQSADKKLLKRINTLIKDIQRQPFSGFGNLEPLKHNWSRCIDRTHRLVYKVR